MKLVLILIFAALIYLRFDAFLINNAFFTDEILLAANIFHKSYIELFFPLDYLQSAPYLFLIASKFISSHFGISELFFRFIPFVSSIVSLFLFYKLCGIAFQKSYTKILALFTFGINYQLLFYTQAFKQYSTDVLFTVLSLYIVLKYKGSKYFAMILGVFALIDIYSSFPAFILLLAIYTTLLIYERKRFKQIICSALFPLFGGLFYYFASLRFVNNSNYLETYWHKGFEIFSSEIYKINFEFFFFDYKFPVLLLILLVVGLLIMYKNNKFIFSLFSTVIFYTLLFALLHIYPFERRLALFLLPVLILISLYPLEDLSFSLKSRIKSVLIVVITSIFFFTGYYNFVKDYLHGNISYLRQDVKPLLEIIKNKPKDEKLYIYYGSLYTYIYYANIKGLPVDNVITASIPENENESEKYLLQDLSELSGKVYLFFVKGTWTYDKDIEALNRWLNKGCVVENDWNLKSARLLKIKVIQ